MELAHCLPGRARLRLPGLRGRSRDLESIGKILSAMPGAGQVRVNPASASLLLTFDPRLLSLPAVMEALAKPGATPAQAQAMAAPPPPAHARPGARAGLSEAEAARRLATFGPNMLPIRSAPPFWRRFLAEFSDLSTVMLLAGSAFSFAIGRVGEALAVAAATGISAVVGAWRAGQEDEAVAAMHSLTPPNATVLRDGRARVVPAAELVPGDMIRLQTGDRVPADAVVTTALDLEADDRHLLGTDAAGPRTYAATHFLRAGSEILRGHGEAEVLFTGPDTTLGKIAQSLGRTDRRPSQVQQRTGRLARDLLKVALIALGVVVGAGLLQGISPAGLVERALSVTAAAIPEGLPTYVTLALAAGARRLARRGAYVQDLSTAAGVSAVNVICTDKTGTLTRGEMTVRTIFAGNHWWSVTGSGFDPTGRFLKAGEVSDPLADADLRTFLEAAVRCNNAALVEGADGSMEVRGSQTEGALLVLALKAGLPPEVGHEPRIGEEAFDPARRRMTLTLGVAGEPVTCTKGAPEAVLPLCNRILVRGEPEPLTEAAHRRILEAHRRMTAEGERVLALAYSHGRQPRGLVFAGLVGIVDPPRRELRPVIARLRRKSIRVIMLTGDHPDTAANVGRDLLMLHPGQAVVTGDDLKRMSDSELARAVHRVPVFARVTPDQKARVIRALQQQGLTVAYVGDGIDDAPAVRAADIGVVPRDRAAGVTREAASIILSDDRLELLETAISQGRNTAENADEIGRYLLTANMGELLLLAASAVFGMPLALLPLQLLWLNLIGDGPAALALGERHAPPDAEAHSRPRRPLIRSLEREILLHGLGVGAAAFGLYATALAGGSSVPVARTLALSALSTSQLVYLFRCRTALGTPCGFRLPHEPGVTVAAVASGLLLLATIYFPPLARALGTAPLTMGQWLAVLGTSLAANLTSVIDLSLQRHRREALPAPA